MSIFKKFLSKNIDKSNKITEDSTYYISIFEKEYFTLKELCNLFLEITNKINYNLVGPMKVSLDTYSLNLPNVVGPIKDMMIPEYPSQIINSFSKDYYSASRQALVGATEVYNIYECYMNFSLGNEKYRNFLKNTRINRGLIIINNKKIYIREILQLLDTNFNKLVIRINTKSSNYDITISWTEFENKVKNLTKKELEALIL